MYQNRISKAFEQIQTRANGPALQAANFAPVPAWTPGYVQGMWQHVYQMAYEQARATVESASRLDFYAFSRN